MRVTPGTVIAFREEYFTGFPQLNKFVVTRLKVNKQNVVGVHARHYKEVCKVLKLAQTQITSKKTPYNGVYLAAIAGLKVPAKVEPKVKPKDETRKRYIEISSGPKPERAKKLVIEIHEQEHMVRQLQSDLVMRLRNLDAKRQEYQIISVGGQELFEGKGIEFDKLVQHPDIESVSINGNILEVLTGPIYIAHGPKVYDIGKFKISLPVNPNAYIVKMVNLTRKRRGTDHPHVNNGNPCLGNIQECLPDIIASRQFAAAINVCIQYLKSSHEGGHLSKLDSWPLKKTEKKNG